jgi:hypothetical protein
MSRPRCLIIVCTGPGAAIDDAQTKGGQSSGSTEWVGTGILDEQRGLKAKLEGKKTKQKTRLLFPSSSSAREGSSGAPYYRTCDSVRTLTTDDHSSLLAYFRLIRRDRFPSRRLSSRGARI